LRGINFTCEGDWRLVSDSQAPMRLYNKSQCIQGLLGTGYGDVLLDLAPNTGNAQTQAADSSTGCMIHASAETQATRMLQFQYLGTAEEIPLTKVKAQTNLGATIHANFSSTETAWAMGWGLQVEIPELEIDHVHTAVGAWSIAPSTQSPTLGASYRSPLGQFGLSLSGALPVAVGSTPAIVLLNDQDGNEKNGLQQCWIKVKMVCASHATADGSAFFGAASVVGQGSATIEIKGTFRGP